MIKQILCKSCVKYKDADTCITRTNAEGKPQIRCADCVKLVRAANLANKARKAA